MKGKVSFDFDETLTTYRGREYAEELIERGYEIWICTARYENPRSDYFCNNDYVFKMAKALGIPREHIKFMNQVSKYHFFKENSFIFHLDDSYEEINMINQEGDTKGIWFVGSSWRSECDKMTNIE
jgi:hypothetical protein